MIAEAYTYSNSLPDEHIDYKHPESIATRWIATYPEEVDVAVRFDTISILAIGENMALLRHHINVLEQGEDA